MVWRYVAFGLKALGSPRTAAIYTQNPLFPVRAFSRLRHHSTHSSPWVPSHGYGHLPSFLNRLDAELKDFAKYSSSCPDLAAVRERVLESYRDVVQDALGKRVDVVCFGSSATGLCLPTADMDLVILGNSPRGNLEESNEIQKQEDRKYALKQLARVRNYLSRSCKNHSTNVFLIRAKGMPIVKMVHMRTGLSIDLSFSPYELHSADGIQHIQYVMDLAKDERIRSLVLLFKHLLKQYKLDSPAEGGLGGFAIACWICAVVRAYDSNASTTRNADSGRLLLRFLEMYTTSDTGYEAIHVPGVEFSPADGILRISDPISQDNNVARAFRQHGELLALFKKLFASLQEHEQSPESGLLSRVLRIRKTEREHRDRLERLGRALRQSVGDLAIDVRRGSEGGKQAKKKGKHQVRHHIAIQ